MILGNELHLGGKVFPSHKRVGGLGSEPSCAGCTTPAVGSALAGVELAAF